MTPHAPTSCFSCRHSKRRCDKNLPTCQLCSRKGLECSYPHRRGQCSDLLSRSIQGLESSSGSNAPYPGPIVVPSSTGSQIQSPSASASSFSVNIAICFLAPALFREAGLEIPRLDIGLPDEVALHLGNSQQIQETASKFFQITWMPIVSCKRYLADILNPLSPSRRPTALLALCMKLCCLSVHDDEGLRKTSLYRLAKAFYCDVESTQALCVQVLQAAILIAIFEIGDAIYPAAYLTVGVCARYAIAMGLDNINKDRMGGEPNTMSWMEIEERRRAWWAVLILDRFVTSYPSSLTSHPTWKSCEISSKSALELMQINYRFLNFASPSRVLATEDPSLQDFLPIDDDHFYNAVRHISLSLP